MNWQERALKWERKRRRVTVYEIEVTEVRLPRIQMRVHCSKGTYIRTLCHDIGESLGCGGCMETLLRTKVSYFSLEDSLRLSEIERLSGGKKNWKRFCFRWTRCFGISKADAPKRKRSESLQWQSVRTRGTDGGSRRHTGRGARPDYYEAQGQFVGIFRCRMKGQQNGVDVRERRRMEFRVEKMFLTQE